MPAGYVRGTDGDSYTDANGVLRVRTGSVPAVGTSSAHWGVAVYDASGNPIFDTNGLIGVLSQPAGSVHPSPAQTITGTTGWVDINGTTLSYTAPRTQTILVLATMVAKVAGTPGEFAFGAINIDGVRHNITDGSEGLWDNVATGYNTAFITTSIAVAFGPHTIKLQGSPDNNALSFLIFTADVYMFLMGN